MLRWLEVEYCRNEMASLAPTLSPFLPPSHLAFKDTVNRQRIERHRNLPARIEWLDTRPRLRWADLVFILLVGGDQ